MLLRRQTQFQLARERAETVRVHDCTFVPKINSLARHTGCTGGIRRPVFAGLYEDAHVRRARLDELALKRDVATASRRIRAGTILDGSQLLRDNRIECDLDASDSESKGMKNESKIMRLEPVQEFDRNEVTGSIHLSGVLYIEAGPREGTSWLRLILAGST